MQRYEEFAEIIINPRTGKRRYSTLYYPKIERKSSDKYIITKITDRLDLIANREYGDPRYWVILAKVNKLNNGTIKPPVGFRLRIPLPLTSGDVETYFRNT